MDWGRERADIESENETIGCFTLLFFWSFFKSFFELFLTGFHQNFEFELG
jgi:hypothetical protein